MLMFLVTMNSDQDRKWKVELHKNRIWNCKGINSGFL